MNKYIITFILIITVFSFSNAQTKPPADTVVIKVGEASKVTFEIRDQNDLQTLKRYDFQAIVNDLISKLEQRDTTALTKKPDEYLAKTTVTDTPAPEVKNETEENWDNSWKKREKRSYRYRKSTYGSLNFDLGTNNYLADGKFPDANNDAYTVKPWGSWFVGINVIERSRIARTFFIEWGGGVSWYNFKFQNPKTLISKNDQGLIFSDDSRALDFKKSKLTACYLNVSLVPMIDFGGNRKKSMFFDSRHSQSVRFGAGPYAGYRIDSYTKQVYKENGDKQKDRNHDNLYVDNIRYGLRFQFGFSDVDFFFNYDMNELFVANKGPKLNAFSFGITL